MPKAVLTTKVDPSYDDLPEERYHFPRTYLKAARAALGDWIVYYEPRRSSAHLSSRGGRQSYFATARIVRVDADPSLADHYYAYVEHYLEFDHPVPFRDDGLFYESRLRKEDGSVNKGMFGRSVRFLPDAEYSMILAAGFEAGTGERERLGREGIRRDPGLMELADRPIIERVSRRPFRDRVFATGIKRAYDNTCAISGLRIINGGGRAEAQAAHIRPVRANGPDSLRNGVALSSTFHWMFDRGLISIDDDYSLLFRRNAVPRNVLSLVNPDGRLRVPEQEIYRPHRRFLEYHREHVFKG
ncbi:MAG: HNH endonuclease [Gemmatimonadetes bacterium]|nr:HNH endonuclease [Gemmatimonadota bacterium]MCY3942432.1 HNH endonuclease [Gemmatimonadota bacterium]